MARAVETGELPAIDEPDDLLAPIPSVEQIVCVGLNYYDHAEEQDEEIPDNDYRNPALVAKMAATLDVVSEGRLELGTPETLAHKIGVIEDHCETVGRDPDEIEYSWDGHVICTRDEEQLEALLDLMLPIQFEEEYVDQADIETEADARDYFVMGTPEECAEAIERRIDAGVTKFQGWFIDFPDTDGMELFADEVMPQFQ